LWGYENNSSETQKLSCTRLLWKTKYDGANIIVYVMVAHFFVFQISKGHATIPLFVDVLERHGIIPPFLDKS
jgi:hypothetical protein